MIRWERDGAVAVALLDRPERRNALTAEGCDLLETYLEGAADARVVILAGVDDAFCAGADLGARLDEAGAGHPDAFRPAFDALVATMAASPAVIVAAIDGPALGAGTQLVAWSDVRIAGDTATFGIPAGRLGVHVAGPSIARLVDVVGMSAAEDLLLTSRVIDADEALRVQLVQYRAPRAFDAARALAADLAALAPRTLAGHKAALRSLSRSAAVDASTWAAIAEREQAAFASADFREGLAARAERRPPMFTGE